MKEQKNITRYALPGFNAGCIRFSSKDIRCNQKGNIRYITLFGRPDENSTIENLGFANEGNTIAKIELLGSKEKVSWNRTSDAPEITRPQVSPNNIALVYKVYQN